MTLDVAFAHAYPGLQLEVAFQAPPGLTALFGRSGAGKTTVVNAVAGLLRPARGHITCGGRVLLDTNAGICLPPHRRRIGYVFQEGRLFPHLSVRSNLRYGGWFAGRGEAGEFDRVVALLGLQPLLDRAPGDLSGGEKQRVAIGRALLSRPQILLMDEPLAALDEARKAEILPWIERLRDAGGVPILYVSHALGEVARLATTLVLIDSGKVVQAGPAADILSDPASGPVLGLREAGAVLAARVAGAEADGLMRLDTAAGPLWLPATGAAPGTVLRIRILARDVILARARPEGLSALNILPGVVTAVHGGDGPGVMVQLRLGADLILARITRRSAGALGLMPGTPVHAILKSVSVARADIGGAD